MELEFWKLNGSGNDFIIIDNREGPFQEPDYRAFVRAICRRKESLGADGVIFLEREEGYDFRWRFFNSDGSEAEMCGNGSRCVARFAYLKGIAGPDMVFLTKAGPIKASVEGRRVKVLMPKPSGAKTGLSIIKDGREVTLDFINTGVPHAVVMTDEIEKVPVKELGRFIRFHNLFQPQGTNVNFVAVNDQNHITVRTYERGVEDETLACGTGSVASALITSIRGLTRSPVSVTTRGGEILKIYFEGNKGSFEEVYLEGDTTLVCKGFLFEEAYLSYDSTKP